MPEAHPIKVLLVDDQPMVGETVRRMLADEPELEFRFCPDPAAAIDVANEFKPTVILQDLVMPDIDGLQLVKYFRELPDRQGPDQLDSGGSQGRRRGA